MDATQSLFDLLGQVPDPRRAEGKRHPLEAVLSLLILSLLAGMRGLQGVVEFGRNLPPDVVAALGFTRPKTLAKSTLSEILRAIDVDAFESVVSRWLQAQANRHGWTAMAIDGKSLRGATGEQLPAVHLVSGYAHEAPGCPGPTAGRLQDQRAQGGPRIAGALTPGRGGRHRRRDVYPRGFLPGNSQGEGRLLFGRQREPTDAAARYRSRFRRRRGPFPPTNSASVMRPARASRPSTKDTVDASGAR